MAAIETTRTGTDVRLFGGRLISLFTDAFATATAWNDVRVTRNELRKLSDRELDDIGLSRADIERL
ncbi:MAG: DUF1127 domain-containing protein [Rhodobacteraceae bacterium]|jgi:uncharacterized protein YjiS (DUF1127 family)|nr:DUF1127 domain-containing protein [Paracoccaceae bacterium]